MSPPTPPHCPTPTPQTYNWHPPPPPFPLLPRHLPWSPNPSIQTIHLSLREAEFLWPLFLEKFPYKAMVYLRHPEHVYLWNMIRESNEVLAPDELPVGLPGWSLQFVRDVERDVRVLMQAMTGEEIGELADGFGEAWGKGVLGEGALDGFVRTVLWLVREGRAEVGDFIVFAAFVEGRLSGVVGRGGVGGDVREGCDCGCLDYFQL
ncbi:hypothetical protein LTR62_003691 [Meristemomyces frigidus]|uniref:Uncharacterized protein n=1 Tax=Meristemomyces frigidus TaxID=1508187 RepID=A0AAN7TRM2_9PEZI|nr:hypothetical protein LTR62_003691 [Meristemomyces frigidus]